MIPKFDNYKKPTADYIAALQEKDDTTLVEETARYVWLSAYASNNPRSDYHWKADALHDEATRRGKPWLYKRGWNNAYESAGHELSDHDIEAAKEPSK